MIQKINNHLQRGEKKIRDDLLHSRTGIKLEEQLAGDNPGKLIKEMNSYIARMYRISEEKIKRFDAYIENYIFAFHVLTDLMRARDMEQAARLFQNPV